MNLLLLILGVFFLFFAATSGVVLAIVAFVPFCSMLFFLIVGLIFCALAVDADSKKVKKSELRSAANRAAAPAKN